MQLPTPIKIIAIDPKRPPMIRKAPYIELFFELSEAATKAWSEDFNTLMRRNQARPKVNATDGLFIETWVRKPTDIAEHLTLLCTTVTQCNSQAETRAQALFEATKAGDNVQAVGTEQRLLNEAVAALTFET